MNKNMNSIIFLSGFSVLLYICLVNFLGVVIFDESVLLFFTFMIAFGFIANVLFPIINVVVDSRVNGLANKIDVLENFNSDYFNQLLSINFLSIYRVNFVRIFIIGYMVKFVDFQNEQNEKFIFRNIYSVTQGFEIFVTMFLEIIRTCINKNILNQYNSLGILVLPIPDSIDADVNSNKLIKK